MTVFVDGVTLITAAWLNAADAVVNSTPLAALATLTPSANTMPYFTGASAAGSTNLSAYARTLLAAADAPTFASLLKAELASIGGLTSAADKVPYFTGVGTADIATLTAFGRSLIADADAAAARSTLGLSLYALLAGAAFTGDCSFSNHNISGIKSLTFNGQFDDTTISGATYTFDFGVAQYHKCVLGHNCTFTFTAPGGPCTVSVQITQDGTGSRVMTLPASVKWDARVAAADKLLSTTAAARDELLLKYNGTDYVATLFKGLA